MDRIPICDESGLRAVTVTTIGPNEALDVNIMGGVVVAAVGFQVRNLGGIWQDVGYSAIPPSIPIPTIPWDGVNQGAISPTWVALPGNETLPALATSAVCHGAYFAAPAGQEVQPFLIDLDDDVIVDGQYPQLVIPLLYSYEPVGASWNRVHNSALWLTTPENEANRGLYTSAANYGYYLAGGVGTRARPLLMDLDDDWIEIEQIPQLVIAELHGYCDEPQEERWQRVHTDCLGNLKVTIGGGLDIGYLDDSLFQVGVDWGAAVGGVYSVDPVDLNDFGVFRISALRSQYIRITDDTTDLAVAVPGGAIGSGILSYGFNQAAGLINPIPLVADADAIDQGIIAYGYVRPVNGVNPIPLILDGMVGPDLSVSVGCYDWGTGFHHPYPMHTQGTMDAAQVYNIPVGGIDYRTAQFTAFGIDVDISGRQSIRHQGTDRYFNMPVSPADVTTPLKVMEGKKEIWSDDFLYWYDDCETKSGGGCSICKWLTDTDVDPAGDGWDPLACPQGNSTVGYVEFDSPGSATFTVRPYEGNWFMKLGASYYGEPGTLTAAECYTKLGEITEKRMSLEFWFSPGGFSFYPVAGHPAYGLLFGFYLFDQRRNTEKRYLIRYNCQILAWQYYNNAAAWVTIALDTRPVAAGRVGVWNPSATWSWQYIKLCIDDIDEEISSLTYQDTTYAIGTAVHTTAGTGGRSGLIPYLAAELACGYAEGEDYVGAIYFDNIKIYINDLELYHDGPGNFGQHTIGVAPI